MDGIRGPTMCDKKLTSFLHVIKVSQRILLYFEHVTLPAAFVELLDCITSIIRVFKGHHFKIISANSGISANVNVDNSAF